MSDPIQDYLARGGTITRCPTVYLLPIPGSEPIRSGVSERLDIDSLPLRDRKRIQRDVFMAKLRAKKAAKGPSPNELQALATQRELATQRRLEADAAILAMFERGESPDEIARLKGRNVKTIKRVLRRAGFTGSFVRANAAQPKDPSQRKPASGPKSLVAPEIVRLKRENPAMSQREIADAVGCTVGTVAVHLRRAGLTKGQPRQFSPEMAAEILRLYAEGYGSVRIAQMVGCSKTGVIGTLHRGQTEMRKPGKNGRADDAS